MELQRPGYINVRNSISKARQGYFNYLPFVLVQFISVNMVNYSKLSENVSLVSGNTNTHIQANGRHGGLTILTTCVFIVGVIAGSGFLTLPKAVDDSGGIGFALVVLCCLASAYTGHLLGKCWTMVLEIHPEFRGGQVRYPYPAIGEEAFGKVGRYVVSASISFTMFGGTIVYVLLSAENLSNLLGGHFPHSFCYIVLIVGAVMTPFTWLGTPKDFWGIAVAASLATGTASLILMASVIHYGSAVKTVTHTEVGFVSFFTAYGTICFAYNGHPAFPTFQSDMKNPEDFGKAVLLGYIIVLLMYLPSTTAAYFVYGEQVKANILNTLPGGATSTIVSILMTAHLLFGIVIVINPVTQELEHALRVPENFTWKRLVTRTLMMALVLFVAVSIPHFSSILSLVGGSTISILAFICPPLYYMKLCRKTHRSVPVHVKVLLYEIVLIGLVAGVAATYSAVVDLAKNKMTVPCYVDPVKAWNKTA